MNKIDIHRRRLGLEAKLALLAATALTLPLLVPARAQNTQPASAKNPASIAEIVVQAERRRSTAQKAAVSVSVRGGQDLQKNGQYSLAQILQDVPGVTGGADTGAGGAGTDTAGTGVTIRGVVYNPGVSGLQILGQVPTTALYTDGVYEGIGGNYDINRVEILRGPQGTLYGRSATAGVVATYTQDPVLGKLGGDETVEIGNYGLLHYTGAINVPLIGDQLALRLSGNHYQRSGYYATHGGALVNDDYRAKLLYRPNQDLSVLLGLAGEFDLTHSGETSGDLVSPNRIVYTSLPLGTAKDHFRQYWGNLEWNLGPATLTYLPALRSWHQNDGNYLIEGGLVAQKEKTPYDQFITQEARLASTQGSPLNWQTGVFFYDNIVKDSNVIRVEPSNALVANVVAKRSTQDLGVFAEATYRFTPAWRLTAGGRYDYTGVTTDESYTANKSLGMGQPGSATFSLPENDATKTLSGSQGKRDFRNATFKLRVEHDLTPANMVYGLIATGFLPGNVEVSTNAVQQPVALSYAEETLTSYEIGSKNRFLDGTLQINGDLYYNDYSGYQSTINIGSSIVPAFTVVSVPAVMKGGELEIQYRATPYDTLRLNAGYVDANYTNIPALYRETVVQKQVLGVPPLTIDPGYDHNFVLPDQSSIDVHADAQFHNSYDSVGLTPVEAAEHGEAYARVGSQIVGNVSATWSSGNGRYSLSGYVRNVANNRYKNSARFTSTDPLVAAGTQFDPLTAGVIERVAF